MALEQSEIATIGLSYFIITEIILLAISAGTWWTVTGSNSGKNMWDLIVGINIKWGTRMSTQDR